MLSEFAFYLMATLGTVGVVGGFATVISHVSQKESLPAVERPEPLPQGFPAIRFSPSTGALLDTTDQVVWWGYARAMETIVPSLFALMAAYCPPDRKSLEQQCRDAMGAVLAVPPPLIQGYRRAVSPVSHMPGASGVMAYGGGGGSSGVTRVVIGRIRM